jgi:Phosphotransferase system mannitol/fructose-specific IIA domain (Ntr-type)
MNLFIDEAIIETKMTVVDSASVITKIGKKLMQAGLVNNDFIEAVINREIEYPTGLPTKIPVALCHTDPEYVKCSFLTVATLETPVQFHEMGNPNNIQEVKIVFFLGILNKDKHIDILKNIMKFIQSEKLLQSICTTDSKPEIKKILVDNLTPN